jgi:hypothetical protein
VSMASPHLDIVAVCDGDSFVCQFPPPRASRPVYFGHAAACRSKTSLKQRFSREYRPPGDSVPLCVWHSAALHICGVQHEPPQVRLTRRALEPPFECFISPSGSALKVFFFLTHPFLRILVWTAHSPPSHRSRRQAIFATRHDPGA